MLPSLQAAIGADNVYQPPLQMGAEDFAYYAKEVPSMFFFVGATAKGIDPAKVPSNHSPAFMLDESALDVMLRVMLQVTLAYLNAEAQAREPVGPARIGRASCSDTGRQYV